MEGIEHYRVKSYLIVWHNSIVFTPSLKKTFRSILRCIPFCPSITVKSFEMPPHVLCHKAACNVVTTCTYIVKRSFPGAWLKQTSVIFTRHVHRCRCRSVLFSPTRWPRAVHQVVDLGRSEGLSSLLWLMWCDTAEIRWNAFVASKRDNRNCISGMHVRPHVTM